MKRRDGVTQTGGQAPQWPAHKRRSPNCLASRFIGRTRAAVRPSFLLPFSVALVGALLLVRWSGDLLGGYGSISADLATAISSANDNRPDDGSKNGPENDGPENDGEDHSSDSTGEDGASGRRGDPSAPTSAVVLATADDDYRTLRSLAVGSRSGASTPVSLSVSGSIPTGRLILSGRDVVIPLARGPPTRLPDAALRPAIA